jgi:hypothetical protein
MKTQSNVSNVLALQKENARSILDEIVREGAQSMLRMAIEAEVTAYIEAHRHLRDEEISAFLPVERAAPRRGRPKEAVLR